eukprot:1307139-Rhodomonas_salina.3
MMLTQIETVDSSCVVVSKMVRGSVSWMADRRSAAERNPKCTCTLVENQLKKASGFAACP